MTPHVNIYLAVMPLHGDKCYLNILQLYQLTTISRRIIKVKLLTTEAIKTNDMKVCYEKELNTTASCLMQ